MIKSKTNKLIKWNPILPKIQIWSITPLKLTKALSQGSKASSIILTTYFHGIGLINYKISNLGSNKNLDHSQVQILAILSTYTRELTFPFRISQLPQNTNKISFKYFIEHLMGAREISNSRITKIG